MIISGMRQKNPHLKGGNPMINVGIYRKPKMCAIATALIDYNRYISNTRIPPCHQMQTLVKELITSGASIIYSNTKCVWSRADRVMLTRFFATTSVPERMIKNRLTLLACGSPRHSVSSSATCLSNGFTART
jgi:hypothetical protein